MEHVNRCKCLVVGCQAHGSEYQSKNNVTVRECVAHAKLRILQDDMDRVNTTPRLVTRKKSLPLPEELSEPASPEMPPLEPCPPISVNSENISSASTTCVLDARMKDIGGKSSFMDGPNKGEPAVTTPLHRRNSAPTELASSTNSSVRRLSGESPNDTQPIAIEKYVYKDRSPPPDVWKGMLRVLGARTCIRVIVKSSQIPKGLHHLINQLLTVKVHVHRPPDHAGRAKGGKVDIMGKDNGFWTCFRKDYASLKFGAHALLYDNRIWVLQG